MQCPKKITGESELYDDSEVGWMLARITEPLRPSEAVEVSHQMSNDSNISRGEFMKTMGDIASLLGKLITTIRELPRPEVTINPELKMPDAVESAEHHRDQMGRLTHSTKTIRYNKPAE